MDRKCCLKFDRFTVYSWSCSWSVKEALALTYVDDESKGSCETAFSGIELSKCLSLSPSLPPSLPPSQYVYWFLIHVVCVIGPRGTGFLPRSKFGFLIVDWIWFRAADRKSVV